VIVVQDVVEGVQKGIRTGRRAVLGRVIDVRGFSTLPGDGLVAIDSAGTQYGDILGRPGSARLQAAAASMLSSAAPGLETVTIAIKDKDVEEIGLACGGQAEVLLQPVSSVPAELWDLMAKRASVALLTRIEGSGAGPAALVVDRDGGTWGGLGANAGTFVDEARTMLEAGTTSTRRVEDESGVVLIEAWVPAPRLVVVGTGELVAALDAQGALLGWDCRATPHGDELGDLLDWAGATAALIVLSHDPHVDAPALAVALQRGVPYVGALGSRATQSRRLERLAATGIDAAAIDRIHRPIGLDLGGRRAPEVALSIAAEILACHRGRDARPLRDRQGPINDRPAARAAR
jgi:xanthine dehydrogenase accessory factor